MPTKPKPKVPPLTPNPTYGAGGKPYKKPKGKEPNPVSSLLRDLRNAMGNERTGLGRSNKFLKGGYMKGK